MRLRPAPPRAGLARPGGRPGAGARSRGDQVGEVGQRVAQMIRRERGESDVLAEGTGDRRPVVGQGDLGPGRLGRDQVIAPDPAAEPQAALAGFLTQLPGDGARRVEYLYPVGHLVAPVRVVGVVHGHPEYLPRRSQLLAVEGSRTQPVPSIAACAAGSARTAKTASAGALMILVALTVSSAMVV